MDENERFKAEVERMVRGATADDAGDGDDQEEAMLLRRLEEVRARKRSTRC
jgi:hypothetical protein